MKSYDVVTIGSAVRDTMFVTRDAETFRNPKADPTKLRLIGFEYGGKIHSENVHRYYGGGANNTAVALARLGLKVAVCIRVGDDADGQATLAHLKREGVRTDFIQQDAKHPTGFSFLVVEAATHEHVAFVDYGANAYLTIPKVVLQAKPQWYYVSSLSTQHWPSLMRAVLRTHVPVAWNPGAIQLAAPKTIRPLLKKIAVLIVNRDEATALAGQSGTSGGLAKQLGKLGSKLVVVTDGRHGAAVFDGSRAHQTKSQLTVPKDTTGAGDAFGSSFIAGLIRFKGNLSTALQLATLNASAEVSQPGAQRGLLRWSELPTQLTRR